jgi:hypothetical protein
MSHQAKVYSTTHMLQQIARCIRIALRHIRFFHPWDHENRAKRRALEVLFRESNLFLRNLGVDYWLVFGTLLGYFREGGIIRHDYDIDFGAHESEYERIWKNRHRLPKGFRLYDTSYKHPGPKLYISYQGWEADIYFFEDMSSTFRCFLASDYQGEVGPFPKNYIYPLKKALFLGESTFVPNLPKPYLTHMYGYLGKDAVQDKITGYWHHKGSKNL